VAKPLCESTSHTAGSKEERLRVASVGDRLLSASGPTAWLHPYSASQALLDTIADDQERELLRLARATNSFAALGVTTAELQEGPAGVRRLFRKRSLAVHPDKVGESMQALAIAAFAKLEAAAKAVEGMLQADASATVLLAELFAASDAGAIEADPSIAAQLLQVPEGSSLAVAQEATRQRYHGPLSKLQDICPKEVGHALKVLALAETTTARGGAPIWTPAEEDMALSVTRALGCSDLKSPVPVLTPGLVTQVLELDVRSGAALVMLSDGARALTEKQIADQVHRHRGRPRAAALQLASDAHKTAEEEAVCTICAYFEMPNGKAAGSMPEAKKAKLASGASGKVPERVRVSHILLRWTGIKETTKERPGFPSKERTQVEAEVELLRLLEELLAGDLKTRALRFKAAVVKWSECPSALNVPHADMGWFERGTTDPTLEAAAFGLGVGDISDIVVSQMGAHLMYRLA